MTPALVPARTPAIAPDGRQWRVMGTRELTGDTFYWPVNGTGLSLEQARHEASASSRTLHGCSFSVVPIDDSDEDEP